MPEVTCTTCGKIVKRRPSEIKSSKTGKFFCSTKCFATWRDNRIKCVCPVCGKPFVIGKKYFAKYTNNFCSSSCYGISQRTYTPNKEGYITYKINGNGCREHRVVMEAYIGRKLTDSEVVHHINGNPADNRIENLKIMTGPEHAYHHRPLTWDIEKAIELRKEGKTLPEIGAFFDVSTTSIRAAFRRRGIQTRPSLTWDIEKARYLRGQGLSFYRIGKMINTAGGNIKRAFVYRGLH